MNDIQSNTYCPYLFQSFDSKVNGPCCYTKNHHVKIDKSSWASINSYQTMLDNSIIQKAQYNSMNNIKDELCSTCWYYEKSNIKSLRQYALTQFGNSNEKVLKNLV